MRRLLAPSFAISLLSAPLQAAPMDPSGDQYRFGAFAGAHLQIPIGRRVDKRTAQLGLTLAPTQTRIAPDGFAKTRIGQGLSLDLAAHGKPQLLLNDRPAGIALGLQRKGEVSTSNKLGFSTGAAVAVGLVAVAAIAAVVYFSQDCDRILGNNQCNGD